MASAVLSIIQQNERLALLAERLGSVLRPQDACLLLSVLERLYRTEPFRGRA
jgi:hypothetical protein